MTDNEGCFAAMFWGMSAVTVGLLWWFFGIAWALVAAWEQRVTALLAAAPEVKP